MGMKKECSCGYWNKEQEECLYNGLGCAKDKQDRLGVPKEWIEEQAEVMRLYVLSGQLHNEAKRKDFIRSLVEEMRKWRRR